MGLHNLYDKLKRAPVPSSGLAFPIEGGATGCLLAWGGATPPSMASVYAPGALYIDRAGGLLYQNIGSFASPSFKGPRFGKPVTFVTAHEGLLGGAGAEGATHSESTAGKFFSFYLANSAASGTVRGLYLRMYLTGGAGGEAARLYNTVSSNAPKDTVNGAHISLDFGASVGNITGLGTACRNTLHGPNRSLGGTTAAVQAELWADGASSTCGGRCSFLRCVVDGADATGIQAIETTAMFAEVVSVARSGGLVPSSFAGNASHMDAALKIILNGVVKYIPLQNAVS